MLAVSRCRRRTSCAPLRYLAARPLRVLVRACCPLCRLAACNAHIFNDSRAVGAFIGFDHIARICPLCRRLVTCCALSARVTCCAVSVCLRLCVCVARCACACLRVACVYARAAARVNGNISGQNACRRRFSGGLSVVAATSADRTPRRAPFRVPFRACRRPLSVGL